MHDNKTLSEKTEGLIEGEMKPAVSKHTPMPAGNLSSPLTKLVSPDEECAMMDCSSTACRKGGEGSLHGEKVLEVVYRPHGESPFVLLSEKDGGSHTLPQERRLCMNSAPQKRKRVTLKSVELVDAITSNAVDSPLRDLGESTGKSPVLRKSLADLVQETALVTKSNFFSHETYAPFLIIDFAVSGATKTSHGPIGSDENLQWFQSFGRERHEFCLEYGVTHEESVNGYRNSKEGQYLRWTAHVLDWIRNFGRRNGRRLESFPQPLQIGASSNADIYALRLGFTHGNKPAFEHEILGTLEDLMHLHHAYNNGPIPETIVAWLVLLVLHCVSTLHQCGVTHNDMGLDSFLLVRRKHITSENDENNDWFLVCVDLGSASIVATEEVLNEMSQRDEDWHFKHDLYGVANIVNLLLAGGVPLSGQRIGDGSIDLVCQRYLFKNIYLRGRIAWEDLFQALLNPTNSACGMHLVDFDTLVGPQDGTIWPQTMTDACRLLELMSNMGGAELGVLDRLMEHMHQIRTDGQWKIPTNDRFPVKLSDNAVEDTGNVSLRQDAQQNKLNYPAAACEGQLLAALNQRSMAESLLADKQNERQRVEENCKAKLPAAMSAFQHQLEQQQKQADTRLQKVEAAFTQRLTNLEYNTDVEMVENRQPLIREHRMERKHIENMLLMAASREQGLLAALSQRDSEFEGLLSESTRRQNLEEQQASARNCESSLLIARLQAENRDLTGKLSAIAKQVNVIQKEKDKLHKEYGKLRNKKNEDATNNKEQVKQLRAALTESEKRFDFQLAQKEEMLERARRAEAQLNSAKSLVIVLEKRLEIAEEKILEAERIRVQALHALQRKHEEALTSLEEQNGAETATQRAELEGLESNFSDQAKELMRVEAWSAELSDELTSVKAAVKGQSQLFEQTLQPLKDEVSRSATEMKRKDAAICHLKQTLRDREQELARQESEQDKSLRKRESDLQRRMEDFEAEMRRRLAEWDQTQVPPARPANAPQQRSSWDGVKRKSPPASQESAASKKYHCLEKRGQKTASSLIIPGQSLTMAGVVQQIARKHGASRVVIDEPSDSDDSEVEL
jgi:hypothetical protein